MEKQLVIKIEGMHCTHCVKRVQDALKAFKQIKKVNIDLESGRVAISLKGELSHEQIIAAICELGYTAEKI